MQSNRDGFRTEQNSDSFIFLRFFLPRSDISKIPPCNQDMIKLMKYEYFNAVNFVFNKSSSTSPVCKHCCGAGACLF